jgi:hypothetical protein
MAVTHKLKHKLHKRRCKLHLHLLKRKKGEEKKILDSDQRVKSRHSLNKTKGKDILNKSKRKQATQSLNSKSLSPGPGNLNHSPENNSRHNRMPNKHLASLNLNRHNHSNHSRHNLRFSNKFRLSQYKLNPSWILNKKP